MEGYREVNDEIIERLDTHQFIPKNPRNTDYKRFIDWFAENPLNVLQPPLPTPIPDPESIIETKRIIRKLKRIIRILKNKFPEVTISENFDNDD